MAWPSIVTAYQNLDVYAKKRALDILLNKSLVCRDRTHGYNVYGYRTQYIPVKSTFEIFGCCRNDRYRLLNAFAGEYGDFKFYHVRIGQKLPCMLEYVRKVRKNPVP